MRAALLLVIAASLALASCAAAAVPSFAPELGLGHGATPAQALARTWADPLTVPLLSGGSRTLHSCADFFAVSKNVSDAIGSRGEQVLLGQAVRCEALRAVQGARPATRTFLAGWTLDAGWRTAPAAFDFQVSPDGMAKAQRITARGGGAADMENVWFEFTDAFHYLVRGSGWSGEFTILVRGLDVTGDGIEDLIISRDVALEEGTLRATTYFVVTRTKPTGPLRVVRSFP